MEQSKPKLIKQLESKVFSGSKHKYGTFECQLCGKHFNTTFISVRSGNATSCGCKRKINLPKSNITHNLSKTRIYSIYKGILSRCKRNVRYAGRGISVCDEWKNDFISFYNWSMSNGYEEHLTIDRIDNNGNYEPLNCRWTTMTVQARNKKSYIKPNKLSKYRGVSPLPSGMWRARITVNYNKFHIGIFNSELEAGIAFDKYIIDNNLEHTTNGLFEKN